MLRIAAQDEVDWLSHKKTLHPEPPLLGGESKDATPIECYSRRSSKNSFTREKKPSASGLVARLPSPASANSRSSSCWRFVRFTGVSTVTSMYMSPREGERSTLMPLPFRRN